MMGDNWVLHVLMALLAVCAVLGVVCCGVSIHEETHPKYSMLIVSTGDVKWACLQRNGETVGCDTVEEYK